MKNNIIGSGRGDFLVDKRQVLHDRRTNKTVTQDSFPLWLHGGWIDNRRFGPYDRRNPNQVAEEKRVMLNDLLCSEMKPTFPALVDDGSGFDYDTQTMTDKEIDGLVKEFSPHSGDVDVALQNMALTIKHLAALLNTEQ